MDAIEIIKNILEITIGFLILYFAKKIKNLATIEDIRKIASEEQLGKLEAEALKKTMSAISKAQTNLEKLSFEICLNGVDKKNEFTPKDFILKLFDIWGDLVETLDTHIFVLNKEIQKEINYFREAWPHISGEGDFKWVGNTLAIIVSKQAAVKIFKDRIKELSDSKTNKKFIEKEVRNDYDSKININIPKIQKNLALSLWQYGIDIDLIKEIFPKYNIELKKSEPV